MEKKRLVILILLLVLVIAGAALLYRNLGAGSMAGLPTLDENIGSTIPQNDTKPDTTPVDPAPVPDGESENTPEDTTPPEDTASPEDTSPPEDTAPPEDTGDSEEVPVYPAPDFTFYHLDGSEAKLSDYFGKPMVLNFWSSNCGPCRSEMPDFQRAYEELGDAVNFVMVNVTDGYWDTVDSASSYVAEEGFTFPVFYDTDNHAAYTYGITGLPTTFFLSAEGNLVAGRSGAMNYDILMGGIDFIYPN